MSNVFVNRTLNLRKIKCIGFDMDHTLVRYNSYEFEKLAHSLLLKKLVSEKNYPQEVLNFKFSFDSVIRGLIIDSQRGNLLKVSRHGAIRVSHHGTKRIEFRDQQKDYRGTYVDLSNPNFAAIDTAFSLSVAILFGQLVDLKDSLPHSAPIPEYPMILGRDQYDGHGTETTPSRASCARIYQVHHRRRNRRARTRAIKTRKDPVHRHKLRYHSQRLCSITPSRRFKGLQVVAGSVSVRDHRREKPLLLRQSKLSESEPGGWHTHELRRQIRARLYQGGCAPLSKKALADGEDILYVGDHIYKRHRPTEKRQQMANSSCDRRIRQ